VHALRVAVMLFVFLLCGGSLAHGQEATERFIPIGQSPGVSGTQGTVGTIVAVDPEQRVLRLQAPAGPMTVEIAEATRIWIDRHEFGLPTREGSFQDCQKGRRAEVKYAAPETRGVADWVKIQGRPPAPWPPP
jgi:hypothetical protein